MYVRVKRGKQTIFLHCDPQDTILSLKKKVEAINGLAPEKQRLMLVDDKVAYDDNKTVRECKIEDRDVIALVYKVDQDDPSAKEKWEDVYIEKPPTLGDAPGSPGG
ncbi:hypothetical protein T484DRAFT_1945935 [Baffinella frigidus]|nr:hypothetical protein T484DRAFT_1945935 [Cryptophyta sp. CCMP2293]